MNGGQNTMNNYTGQCNAVQYPCNKSYSTPLKHVAFSLVRAVLTTECHLLFTV